MCYCGRRYAGKARVNRTTATRRRHRDGDRGLITRVLSPSFTCYRTFYGMTLDLPGNREKRVKYSNTLGTTTPKKCSKPIVEVFVRKPRECKTTKPITDQYSLYETRNVRRRKTPFFFLKRTILPDNTFQISKSFDYYFGAFYNGFKAHRLSDARVGDFQ